MKSKRKLNDAPADVIIGNPERGGA